MPCLNGRKRNAWARQARAGMANGAGTRQWQKQKVLLDEGKVPERETERENQTR